MSTGWIVLGVIVVLVLLVFSAYNRLVALGQRVGQAFADIDVQLKQRHDLIPNLVETVKGYAAHERGTLDDVIKARNAAMSAQGPAQVAAAENQLSGALGRLIALSEAYPDLKANANFQQLASELSDLENKIAASRRFFNNAVQEYNTGIQQMPAALFAGMFGFTKKDFFDLGDEPHRSRGGAAGEVLSLSRQAGRAARHGRVWSLHAHRIEQVSFDAAARRPVRAGLCAGLCRRAARRSRHQQRRLGRLLSEPRLRTT